MADKKTSELTEFTTLATGDYLPVLDATAGELQKISAANFASTLPFDDSATVVIEGSTFADAVASTDTALVSSRSTGVRSGGAITVNGGNPALIDVAAGAGELIDNTDPDNPIFYSVTWSSSAGEAPSAGTNWVYVTNAGVITLDTVEPTPAQRRTRIYLGRVSVTGGVVTGIASIVVPILQHDQQLADLARAVGLIKTGGLVPSAAASNLTLAVSSGEIYSHGQNVHTDPLNPHFVTIAEANPATFRMVLDSVVPTDVAVLPVGFYNVGGTATAIPGATTRASIFQVFMFASGNIRIAYGTNWYTSLSDAVAALSDEAIPASMENALRLGWIVATSGCTDLSDTGTAQFVTANRFGLRP